MTGSKNTTTPASRNNNTVGSSERAASAEQNVKLEKLQKQYDELLDSQNFISKQYDEVVKELKKCVDVNSELKKELSAISRKCVELSAIVSSVKSKQNHDEQQKLNRNVIVRGINQNEDAEMALQKIAILPDFTLAKDDLSSVKQQSFNNKGPVITAQFKESEKKKAIRQSSKTKKKFNANVRLCW